MMWMKRVGVDGSEGARGCASARRPFNPFPVTENADRAPVRPHIERALWRSRTASEMHPTYLARPLRGLAAVRTNRVTYFFRSACRLQESMMRTNVKR